jgi:hypothetical protein
MQGPDYLCSTSDRFLDEATLAANLSNDSSGGSKGAHNRQLHGYTQRRQFQRSFAQIFNSPFRPWIQSTRISGVHRGGCAQGLQSTPE